MTQLRQVHVKESLLKANDFVAQALRERWSRQGANQSFGSRR